MDFHELRRRAEAAASGARSTITTSSTSRYEPVRPSYTAQQRTPSHAQSTVLQLDAVRRAASITAPPRRAPTATLGQDSAPPSYTPAAAETQAAPPTPARKPSTLARPPAPPPRSRAPAPTRHTPSATATSTAATSSSTARPVPAPPYSHARTHDLPSPSTNTASRSPAWKSFSDYGDTDKRDLFDALDSFFDSRLQVTAVPYTVEVDEPAPEQVAHAPYVAPSPSAAPPPVANASRPRLAVASSSSTTATARTPAPKPRELHAPSYPPQESHSSAALSLAHFILSSPFSTAWFAPPTGAAGSAPSSPLPPPLVGRSDVRFTASWAQHGLHISHVGAALFGDASVAWWRLSWTAQSESAGRAHVDVRREARYRLRPDISAWDAHALYAESERVGAHVERFAEEAVRRGVPVARGECWDLASEALDAAGASITAAGDKPFPSIGRTHGALLYHARAGKEGVWQGGDAYVRPGDVVEWRAVRICEVGAAEGAYMRLGDPDHTAVILSAAAPLAPPALPATPPYSDPSYPLASLTALTVAEQSLGQPPSIRTYDLSTMSEGEVWIYRPCGMSALCGVGELEAVWPDETGVECWSVGELE